MTLRLKRSQKALSRAAASAIHADPNVGSEQAGGEGIGRELCALVGVEDLGSTFAERLAQGIETEDAVQSVCWKAAKRAHNDCANR